MELFYSEKIENGLIVLNQDETRHCLNVKRHRIGDVIHVVDGKGGLFTTVLTSVESKEAVLKIEKQINGFGEHPYYLNLCVAPVKNQERYEWFLEKATEMGIDRITPIVCTNSERKISYKPQRIERIIISAAKQSLKARFPVFDEPVDFKKLIDSTEDFDGVRLIAHCNREISTRIHVSKALNGSNRAMILIGPEGDFTSQEIQYAEQKGFTSVHLGDSRLRTETAALVAVAVVYLGSENI